MDELEDVGRYFERKRALWTSTEGSVGAHLRRLGRNELVAEFRSDPDFEVVGRYLHRVSNVQYVQDTGYGEFRARVRDSVSGPLSPRRETERQVTRIVRAALLASGISAFGERLVRVGGALPR